MTNMYKSVLAALEKCPLVPVLTIEDAGQGADLAKALVGAGLTVAEVTLRTADALKVIENMKRAAPELIVGAGTILSIDDLNNAVEAGSDFVVTPATDKYLREALIKISIPVFPGCATPSEALTLYRHGFEYLKFFPAESNGGVKALKSMAAPMPDIKFMPTGGINERSVKDYLDCPNVIAVGGSWMIDQKALKNSNWNLVENLAQKSVSQI